MFDNTPVTTVIENEIYAEDIGTSLIRLQNPWKKLGRGGFSRISIPNMLFYRLYGYKIEAVSGSLTDEITIRKVEKANPDYSFGDAGEVVNWFDKDEIDPAYFSIKDKFGDLMRHSGTAAIVGKIMAKAQASRGDVAKSTSENKVLQQMLAQMSFESLLKQAGANVVPPEMVKAINDMLQKVKKD